MFIILKDQKNLLKIKNQKIYNSERKKAKKSVGGVQEQQLGKR